MRTLSGFSVAVAAAGACLISGSAKPIRAAAPSPAIPYVQYHDDRRWDEPPSEYDEVRRKGFHDGMDGARRDFDNHRSPDPHNREEFRHPKVPKDDHAAYREAFEHGYQIAWDHISHGR